jgi:hypothetical protein
MWETDKLEKQRRAHLPERFFLLQNFTLGDKMFFCGKNNFISFFLNKLFLPPKSD